MYQRFFDLKIAHYEEGSWVASSGGESTFGVGWEAFAFELA